MADRLASVSHMDVGGNWLLWLLPILCLFLVWYLVLFRRQFPSFRASEPSVGQRILRLSDGQLQALRRAMIPLLLIGAAVTALAAWVINR